MADIAFFCIPAHGHTNPTLPVVRALTDMGHRVTYYSVEPFRSEIEAAGARFVDCGMGNAVTAAGGNAVARDILVSTKLIVDTSMSRATALPPAAVTALPALQSTNRAPAASISDRKGSKL